MTDQLALLRLKPSAQAVLDALREAPAGLTPGELWMQVGVYRASARVMELRRAGYSISCEHVRDAIYRYRLEA